MSYVKLVGQNSGTYYEIQSTSSNEILVSDSTSRSTLSTISGKLPATLGQTTKSGSLSVTVASDETVSVSDSTSQSTLSTISGKLPSTLGQTTKSGSLSVTLASDSKTYSSATLWAAQSISTDQFAETTAITMTTHSKLQIYGSTNNTTDTTIYLELSDDNSLYYRYTEKVIMVDTSNGNFGATFTDICVPYVKVYKANASGSSEEITLKYTIMK